jgi:hypothetical protein
MAAFKVEAAKHANVTVIIVVNLYRIILV